MKRGEKRVGIVGWLFTFIIGCGVYDGKEGPRMKLPPSEELVAFSLNGERDFANYKVQFQGWESEYYQQTVFITDRATKQKSFAFAYVLPTRLVREIWGKAFLNSITLHLRRMAI